jgi:hypothetical protein
VAEKVVFVVFGVIPAKAGIQCYIGFLDSRLRGSDGLVVFFSNLPKQTRGDYKNVGE